VSCLPFLLPLTLVAVSLQELGFGGGTTADRVDLPILTRLVERLLLKVRCERITVSYVRRRRRRRGRGRGREEEEEEEGKKKEKKKRRRSEWGK
jgi:hypothetical protein